MSIPTVQNFDINQIPSEGSATFRSDASYVWSTIPNVITDFNAAVVEINNTINNTNTDVTTVAGIVTETTTVAGIKAEIQSLYADKTTLDSLYTDKTTLDSLYADKTTLDSLYADKTTLDSIFADKAKLDSLYTDKATLDSLFSDKATLDSIFADKTTLDSLYTDKAKLDSIFADKYELDSIYTKLSEITTVAINITDVTNFSDVYQGGKATAPATRNDTSALVVADLYFDTTANIMKVYDGSAWQVAYSSVNGTLLSSNNLSDLADANAARTNLGLGNIDNTADVDKPVSNAQQTALDLKADQATTYTKTEVNNKPTGLKNYIINGGFDIWQRGTSFGGVVGNFGYTADRWVEATSSSDVYSIDKVILSSADVTITGSQNALRATTVAGGVDTLNDLRTKVENLKQFSGKTLTLSFFYRGTPGLTVNNIRIGYVDSSTPSNTITLSTSWQKFEHTFSVPELSATAIVDGTFLDVVVSSLVNVDGYYEITSVQLEEGSVATPFENRPIGLELSLCQRYYTNFSSTYLNGNHGNSYTTSSGRVWYIFPVEMRAIPTITTSGLTADAIGNGGHTFTNVTNGFTDKTGTTFDLIGITPAVGIYQALVYTGDLFADAEL